MSYPGSGCIGGWRNARRFAARVGAVAGFLVFLLTALCAAGSPRPNVLFVLIDDLGYGDFSCTGNREVQTPSIDRLAAEGTRLGQFHVNSPICSPSRVAFTTAGGAMTREERAGVDLSGSPVVDNHCHGFRSSDLLRLEPEGAEDRLTMMGMCLLSSGQTDPKLACQVADLRDTTIFALTARRWLAAYLRTEPASAPLAAARHAAYAADPVGYVAGLMADQSIEAVIADDGYPQPPVPRADFERELGVPVYRVARIEPFIHWTWLVRAFLRPAALRKTL